MSEKRKNCIKFYNVWLHKPCSVHTLSPTRSKRSTCFTTRRFMVWIWSFKKVKTIKAIGFFIIYDSTEPHSWSLLQLQKYINDVTAFSFLFSPSVVILHLREESSFYFGDCHHFQWFYERVTPCPYPLLIMLRPTLKSADRAEILLSSAGPKEEATSFQALFSSSNPIWYVNESRTSFPQRPSSCLV